MEVGEAAPRGSPPNRSSLRRRSARERAQRDQAPHDTCSGQTLRALTPRCHRLRPVVHAGSANPPRRKLRTRTRRKPRSAAWRKPRSTAQPKLRSVERDPGDPPLFAALARASTAGPPLLALRFVASAAVRSRPQGAPARHRRAPRNHVGPRRGTKPMEGTNVGRRQRWLDDNELRRRSKASKPVRSRRFEGSAPRFRVPRLVA